MCIRLVKTGKEGKILWSIVQRWGVGDWNNFSSRILRELDLNGSFDLCNSFDFVGKHFCWCFYFVFYWSWIFLFHNSKLLDDQANIFYCGLSNFGDSCISFRHTLNASIVVWPGWTCSWRSKVSEGSIWFQDIISTFPYWFCFYTSNSFEEEAGIWMKSCLTHLSKACYSGSEGIIVNKIREVLLLIETMANAPFYFKWWSLSFLLFFHFDCMERVRVDLASDDQYIQSYGGALELFLIWLWLHEVQNNE